MPYKVLMFDLDDTLVIERAAEGASFLASCHCVQEFGGNPEEASRTVQETARRFWEALPVWPWCDSIGISPWEGLWGDFSGVGKELGILRSNIEKYRTQVWETALGKYGIRNIETVRNAERVYREERARRHEVYPGVYETLTALKEHFTLVLLTNGAPGVQREKTVRPGLGEYFYHLVISGEIGVGKPDRRIFEYALEKAGAARGEALMIGDNPVRDIDGARRCGIGTVWVNYSGALFPGDGQPDYEIRAFRELLKIMEM